MEELNELYMTGPIKVYKDGELVDEDATVIDECHISVFMNDSKMLDTKNVNTFMKSMQGRMLIATDILPDNIEEFVLGVCAAKVRFSPDRFTEIRVIPRDEDNYLACMFAKGLQEASAPRRSFWGGYQEEEEEEEKAGAQKLAYNTDWGNNISLPAKKIIDSMKAFTERSELFASTRAVHGAEIYDGNAVLKFMEDINKSNAIYKVLGYALSCGIDLSSSAILTTGRIFKESVEACQVLGCNFIISKAAATKQAIEYAMNNDMTLVGMCRGDTFKVYCGEERIIY